MPRRNQGFTLIELSIVLVIIGLIVGGVLVGRDLINAAKIRKQVTQLENFSSAVQTFRTKYNCLPGDCKSANARFGLSEWSGTGNGDGNITCAAAAGGAGCWGWSDDSTGENMDFWAHLTSAKLIPPIPDSSDPNWNALSHRHPRPMMSYAMNNDGGEKQGAIGIAYSANWAPNTAPAKLSSIHFYYFAWRISGANEMLRPVDVMAVDQKMDDGYPLTGIIRAEYVDGGHDLIYVEDTTNCTQATTPVTYRNSDTFACAMVVQAPF